MNRTPIEWATFTSNPIYAVNKLTGKRGWHCEKVNLDCKPCYAEKQNLAPGPRGGTGLQYSAAAREHVEIRLSNNELERIRGLNRSRRIRDKNGLDRPTCFMGDMTDLGGAWVLEHMSDLILDACESNTRAYFMFLTKRPGATRDYLRKRWAGKKPPEHIWIGASAGRQEYVDEMLPLLLEIPAAYHYWSYEPASEPVDARRYLPGIDMAIIGGQSGDDPQPMDPAWALDVMAQCRESGTAIFFKQFGEYTARELGLKHKKGGGPLEDLPPEFRVREFRRTKAGIFVPVAAD